MIIEKKAEYLKYIEELISEIQQGKNIKKNTDSIVRTLNREFTGVVCEKIMISETDHRSKFFGMSLTPTELEMSRMVDSFILNKRTFLIKKYVISIDHRLLFDERINATPSEIVAILLHEIGHILFTDRIYSDFKKTVLTQSTVLGLKLSSLIAFIKIKSSLFLFQIIIFEMCKNYSLNMISDKSEIDADKFVIYKGYGEDLNNIILKLIAIGERDIVNKKQKDIDLENKVITNWTLQNIFKFNNRLRHIQRELQIEHQNTNHPYYKQFIGDNLSKIDDIISNAMRKIRLEEQFAKVEDEMRYEVLNESILNFKRIPRINKANIDEVRIELQRVDSIDDKLYVLEMINIRKSDILTAIELISEDNEKAINKLPSLETLKDYLNQLEYLQDALVKKDVTEKQYGVFIKYPKGYEG